MNTSPLKGVLIALLIALPLSALAAFPDVYPSHPNAEAITYVQEEGIVSGYPDGTFGPDRTMNRAEFLKIVLEATQSEPHCSDTRSFFSDVPLDAWFAAYVCRAKQLNLIQGYPDGTFRPGATINFAEAAKIIAHATGIPTTTDANVWYQGSVEFLAKRQAIPLSIPSFDHALTRGEMAEIIWRINAKITTKPSRTYADMASPSGVTMTTIQTLSLEGETTQFIVRSNSPQTDGGYVHQELVAIDPDSHEERILFAGKMPIYGKIGVLANTPSGYLISIHGGDGCGRFGTLYVVDGTTKKEITKYASGCLIEDPDAVELDRYIEYDREKNAIKMGVPMTAEEIRKLPQEEQSDALLHPTMVQYYFIEL
jgi:hypothetical protein